MTVIFGVRIRQRTRYRRVRKRRAQRQFAGYESDIRPIFSLKSTPDLHKWCICKP